MRIGIDCRTILNPELGEVAGIGHYTYFLVKHLLEQDGENTYVLFFDARTRNTSEFKQANTEIRYFPFSQYRKFLPFAYSHMLISAALLKARLNVYHSPANVLPLTYRKKSVVTVHDLAIYQHPEWFPTQVFSTRLLVPQSVKRASHIIAISECTKKDLQEMFNVPAKKLSVIYEAPFVEPLKLNDRNTDVQKKFGIDSPYVLFVGTLEPRKNLMVLLDAFVKMRQKSSFQNTHLVLAGAAGYKSEMVLAMLKSAPYKHSVKYLGYISHNEKLALYKKAECFVFPSLYEGFGLPVAEAMQLGVPVITSNGSSLVEVGENAALLVNPEDTAALAAAIEKVLASSEQRNLMIKKGFEQVKKFSWEKAAEQTLEVYKKVGQKNGKKHKADKGKKK